MSKDAKPGLQVAACMIALIMLVVVLFKFGLALFVAVVHRFWRPEHWWQWAFLNSVLCGLSSALTVRSLAWSFASVISGFLGGAVLGAIVEPDMGFVDVFMWPF